MKSLVVFLAAVVTAAATLGGFPATVQAAPKTVVGGGLATFNDVYRLSSYFGVLATMQEDGTTTGEFTCVVVDFVVVLGSLDKATLNSDGSIRFDGTSSMFLFDGTVYENVPYAVTVWEGGPKAGKFVYNGDAETVLVGGIQIKH